jgi:hypothetical protein
MDRTPNDRSDDTLPDGNGGGLLHPFRIFLSGNADRRYKVKKPIFPCIFILKVTYRSPKAEKEKADRDD